MVRIETLMNEYKVSKVKELEKERQVAFLLHSYKNNLEHAKFVQETFPRWSIISGYYAMHDISKLLLIKNFNLKVEREVHATTIKLIRELIRNKKLFKLFEQGYKNFTNLASDLTEAKKERTKTQYYTGTVYMKEEFKKKSENFLIEIVEPYVEKIKKILNEK